MIEQISANIPGIKLRHFQGESDFPGLAYVLKISNHADGIERFFDAEQLANAYKNYLVNCDPYEDMIIVEIAGKMIGYVRGWWEDEEAGRVYKNNGFLDPEWRRRNIGTLMLHWVEARLSDIAAMHKETADKLLHVDVSEKQLGTIKLLEANAYQAVRYFLEMVQPNLNNIHDTPLPQGLELRPVVPEHYRKIWQSIDATGKDEWGYKQPTEEDYQEWITHPHFQPDLWQVAWEVKTDQVIGHVLTYIDEDLNLGFTEGIGVDESWRKRGVATALIYESLKAQKAAGMTESALVVDTDNKSGASSLYEKCGFQKVNTDIIYRKPL